MLKRGKSRRQAKARASPPISSSLLPLFLLHHQHLLANYPSASLPLQDSVLASARWTSPPQPSKWDCARAVLPPRRWTFRDTYSMCRLARPLAEYLCEPRARLPVHSRIAFCNSHSWFVAGSAWVYCRDHVEGLLGDGQEQWRLISPHAYALASLQSTVFALSISNVWPGQYAFEVLVKFGMKAPCPTVAVHSKCAVPMSELLLSAVIGSARKGALNQPCRPTKEDKVPIQRNHLHLEKRSRVTSPLANEKLLSRPVVKSLV